MFARFNTKTVVICGVCVALAAALNQFPLFRMPQGGSVTACSMFFIALAAYWFGPAAGITAGAVMGMLDLMLGGYVVHPAQLLLDYPLAFGFLGAAGFFRDIKFGLYIGFIAGALGRFFMHFLSGIIFFAEYAPAGQHPALYSGIYNISYIGVELAATLAIISIPAFRAALERVKAA